MANARLKWCLETIDYYTNLNNMNELFSEKEVTSLSPIDQWLSDFNIRCLDFGPGLDQPWVARNGNAMTNGNTKEIASMRMAAKLKIKFYR